MSQLQLYAVTEWGAKSLPVPEKATTFDDLYDDLALGVYSALRTHQHNKFLWLEAHLDRTERSMALLGWDFRLDRERLRQALHDVCTAYPLPEARVRFDVLAEPAYRLGTDSRVLIVLMPFVPIPERLYKEGVKVEFARNLARERPLAKTADFALKRRAYPAGAETYEYLMLNEQGYILEGTGTNFYGVRDGALRTASDGVLEGVTRSIILKLAAELEIPVRLEAVHVDEIPSLEEAALSGSSRGLLPVVNIAGQLVGDGRPGPICRRLLAAYKDFVAREIKTAVE
ncbi:MAG TPA: aminotransferase class IV [Anaerolineae bacterium]